MNSDDIILYVFFAFFAAAVIAFLYRIVKYGGFKGAMFGADITRTVGEVECSGQLFGITALRVHVLGGGTPDRAIGLEIVSKSVGSYQMSPVTLSTAEARKLSSLLQTATGV